MLRFQKRLLWQQLGLLLIPALLGTLAIQPHVNAQSSGEDAMPLRSAPSSRVLQLSKPSSYSTPPKPLGASPVTAPGSAASAISATSQSLHVQAGTSLTIAFMSSMDSRITNTGEPFNAKLVGDLKDADGEVVLPGGSLIRGRIGSVRRPGLFSKGGAIDLDFDHVVMPSGDLLPIHLRLSTDNTQVNQSGVLYTDPGIGQKVRNGVEDGKETFNKFKDAGFNADGAAKIITVPGGIVAGAVSGAAVTTGKAVKAVVGRGESVVIKPGDTIVIQFSKDGVL